MSANVSNQVSYLRTTRNFPAEIDQLAIEVNKSYIDIANTVNSRIISIFPTNRPVVNGESWFLYQNRRQEAQRQVYTFTSTSNIPHGVMVTVPGQFIRAFGSFTDGTNTYGLIYGSSVAIAGQISFYVTGTNIVFLTGAGAPSLTRGTVVLEWLNQP